MIKLQLIISHRSLCFVDMWWDFSQRSFPLTTFISVYK